MSFTCAKTTAFLASLALCALGGPSSTALAAGEARGKECAAIADSAARLACFDTLYTAPAPAPVPATAPAARPAASAPRPPAPLPPTPPVKPQAPPAPAAQEFGQPLRTPDSLPTTLRAVVDDVSKVSAGYLQIELDNGQTWRQTELNPRVYLKRGDTVTIRRGWLGSYLLEAPSRYSTRVQRLK